MFLEALGKVIAPVAAVTTSVATAASKVVDQFTPPIVKSVMGTIEKSLGGGSSDGSLPGGLKVEVNVLKGVVATQPMDATSKSNIQNALDQVKAGKPLSQCLSQLSEKEKTKLADTIGNAGFEPPEQLTPYLTNKSQGDSWRMDCALKNVEVAESEGYDKTEASALMRFLPLAAPLLGH
ncbi:MAG TPA: hypothetical protein VFA20_11015 [Myxococcaceae bacterium]|nr:hypothetical protein [Myxococcaceae bacterium]